MLSYSFSQAPTAPSLSSNVSRLKFMNRARGDAAVSPVGAGGKKGDAKGSKGKGSGFGGFGGGGGKGGFGGSRAGQFTSFGQSKRDSSSSPQNTSSPNNKQDIINNSPDQNNNDDDSSDVQRVLGLIVSRSVVDSTRKKRSATVSDGAEGCPQQQMLERSEKKNGVDVFNDVRDCDDRYP